MSLRKNYNDNSFFNDLELQCPTSHDVVLQEGFLSTLITFRMEYNKPMTITSACRSQEHNDWLRSRGYPASANSFHKIGNTKYNTDTCAVDVACSDGVSRKDLVELALKRGWSVGVAKTFIHIDRRSDYTELPQVLYVY